MKILKRYQKLKALTCVFGGLFLACAITSIILVFSMITTRNPEQSNANLLIVGAGIVGFWVSIMAYAVYGKFSLDFDKARKDVWWAISTMPPDYQSSHHYRLNIAFITSVLMCVVTFIAAIVFLNVAPISVFDMNMAKFLEGGIHSGSVSIVAIVYTLADIIVLAVFFAAAKLTAMNLHDIQQVRYLRENGRLYAANLEKMSFSERLRSLIYKVVEK